MIPHDLPDYVERGGRQVWRPPYAARQAQIFGFVLRADRSAIDSLLQRDLVEPAGGAVDYRCPQEHIVVTFAAIKRMASGDSTDRLRGYLPELEVSVWCLAADVIATTRLAWYLPYVFTDSGQTVATGREVYGYPKQIGLFPHGYPVALASGGVTTVQALAIDPYGPNEVAVPRPMISAERLAPQPDTPPEGVVDSGASAFAEFTGLFTDGLEVGAGLPFGPQPPPSAVITPITAPPPPGPSGAPPWAARRLLGALQGRALTGDPRELIIDMVNNPTLVFLKQFRDLACPTKACYQAVVEAPIAVDPVGASYDALDPDVFRITIEDWASHPIATELGVAPRTPLTPELVFRATLDFDVQLGLEVWRAPI